MITAGDFVATPSGWLIITMLGLLVSMVGFVGVRTITTQDKHGDALIEVAKAVAVLISSSSTTEQIVADAVSDIDDLRSAVAVLQNYRNTAEKLSAETRSDVRSLLAGRHLYTRSMTE